MRGLFEPMVMQFSLCNALSTFQRMMDSVLEGEKVAEHIKVYIDDVMIHTQDVQTNRYWTRHILEKLQRHGLCCRPAKCAFEQDETEFLRMEKGCSRVKVSASKIRVILGKKPPMMKKVVHQFLGMANYHCKFIKGYSNIVQPLHELTKDLPFRWMKKEEGAFQVIKTALLHEGASWIPEAWR
jgi:hypothetical protein